jgi:hypothetical protein
VPSIQRVAPENAVGFGSGFGLGDALELGDKDALAECEGEIEALGDTEREAEALGLCEADGDCDALALPETLGLFDDEGETLELADLLALDEGLIDALGDGLTLLEGLRLGEPIALTSISAQTFTPSVAPRVE